MLIAAFLITLLGSSRGDVFAGLQGEREYFPETGHWVSDDFLIKYHSIPNPEEIYGNPITEAFQDKDSGLTIQYFEKTRFELHPLDVSDLRVRLSALGSVIYIKGQTLPGIFNPSACRLYNQSDAGYYVCYDFLTFFDKNGGVSQFGYPISNFEVHDGWIVQYFQRARFEWHPENPLGQWVTVSNLGRQYFNLHSRDPRLLRPIRNNNIFSNNMVTDLNVRAYVGQPVMPSVGKQTLYIIVQDQDHNPVEDANLAFTLLYPNGDTKILQMRPTNEFGISIYRFPINSENIGTVKLEVTASRTGLENVSTITSFQIWW